MWLAQIGHKSGPQPCWIRIKLSCTPCQTTFISMSHGRHRQRLVCRLDSRYCQGKSAGVAQLQAALDLHHSWQWATVKLVQALCLHQRLMSGTSTQDLCRHRMASASSDLRRQGRSRGWGDSPARRLSAAPVRLLHRCRSMPSTPAPARRCVALPGKSAYPACQRPSCRLSAPRRCAAPRQANIICLPSMFQCDKPMPCLQPADQVSASVC